MGLCTGAPFIKGVLIATTGASIFAQALRAGHGSTGLLQAAYKLTAFQSPGELVFGVYLLYYFRVLERQAGTAKFSAFAVAAIGISSLIQAALTRALKVAGPSASGPYALTFACLVQFFLNIPASSKFIVAGLSLSDKTFTYLAALQLLLIGGRSTVVAGVAGLVAGCLYKLNVLGFQRLRFPAAVNRFFASTIGTLLRDSQQPQQASTSSSRSSRGPSSSRSGQQGRGNGAPGQVPQPQAAPQQTPGAAPSEEALQRLLEMGFDRSQAVMALQATNNNVDMAITLLVG